VSGAQETQEYRQWRFTRPRGATEILLVRHGESAPARPDEPFPLVDGHGDPPLDPRGEEQAVAIATRLAEEDVAAIYVTPLRRTLETAEPLARRLGLEPVVEAGLREVFLGDWEGGRYRQRVAERDPLVRRLLKEQRWDVIPGAEPAEAFAGRIREAITAIAARHQDRCVAVFTHGGVIGQVLADATDSRPFAFVGADNGSISHLVVIGDDWVVRRYNDTAHLAAGFSTAPESLT
jgi:probable phosphoglycerate mutase